MGIPGSQEVVAAGSSAPSRVRASRAGSVAGPGPKACGARGEQKGVSRSALRACAPQEARLALARARARTSLPAPYPRPHVARHQTGSSRVQDGDSAVRSPGRVGAPLRAARARAPDAPLKIAGTRLYLVRRIPARTRASHPAPPHAAPR